MPSPTTVIAVITAAMRHIGAIATGETPTAEEAQDGLEAFNNVLETLSLQGMAVYNSDYDQFTTVPAQSSYTIGIGGDFNTDRPVSIISDGFIRVSGIDYPISTWTLSEYGAAALKSQPEQIVQRLAYVNDFPLGKVLLWPTPTTAVPIFLNIARVLTNASSVSQAISYPPGYGLLLEYSVGTLLQTQYGAPVDVSQLAMKTLALVKRANRQSPRASFDDSLMVDSYIPLRVA
jgi:hypothetical protein